MAEAGLEGLLRHINEARIAGLLGFGGGPVLLLWLWPSLDVGDAGIWIPVLALPAAALGLAVGLIVGRTIASSRKALADKARRDQQTTYVEQVKVNLRHLEPDQRRFLAGKLAGQRPAQAVFDVSPVDAHHVNALCRLGILSEASRVSPIAWSEISRDPSILGLRRVEVPNGVWDAPDSILIPIAED